MKKSLTLTIVIILLIAANSNALMISGSASGAWSNVGSANMDDVYSITNHDTSGGIASFNWGTPSSTADLDSMFSFNGVGTEGDTSWIFDTNSESSFLLGNFVYRNGQTINAAGINSVTLNISLNSSSPLNVINETFSFVFSIENTPNTTGNAVLDGDMVRVTSAISDSVFYYEGIAYTLELLGFSNDSGDTLLSDFSSPEEAYSEAGLYGRIIENPAPLLTSSFFIQNHPLQLTPVPEPSTILLLGGGLAGLAFYARRRRKA